jgi:hypothetical protein
MVRAPVQVVDDAVYGVSAGVARPHQGAVLVLADAAGDAGEAQAALGLDLVAEERRCSPDLVEVRVLAGQHAHALMLGPEHGRAVHGGDAVPQAQPGDGAVEAVAAVEVRAQGEAGNRAWAGRCERGGAKHATPDHHAVLQEHEVITGEHQSHARPARG